MSSECDALRAQLERIEAQIAGLESRFIPKAANAIGISNPLLYHKGTLNILREGSISPFPDKYSALN